MPQLVLRQDSGHVCRLTLNVPERRNAMDASLAGDLVQAALDADTDDNVRVLVITGSGNAFSAGGDMDMLRHNTTLPGSEIQPKMLDFYRSFLAIRQVSKPIIAAINGPAIGAGMCLALACDLRVAASDAILALNFTALGLSPGMGATWLLPRLVGIPTALELLMTGRRFDGAQAAAMGLVNRAVDQVQLDETVNDLATRIAEAGPIAVRLAKQMVYASVHGGLDDALLREAAAQAITFPSEDMKEGLAALSEKRAPDFRGV